MNKKLFMILFAVSLGSNCSENSNINKGNVLIQNSNGHTLKFKGVFETSKKQNPWDKIEVVFYDINRNRHLTSIPVSDEVMNIMLQDSNYFPNRQMLIDVADVFFQTISTPCPDGDSFVIKSKGGTTSALCQAVDRNGILWKLSVISKNGIHIFSSKKTQKLYRNFIKF